MFSYQSFQPFPKIALFIILSVLGMASMGMSQQTKELYAGWYWYIVSERRLVSVNSRDQILNPPEGKIGPAETMIHFEKSTETNSEELVLIFRDETGKPVPHVKASLLYYGIAYRGHVQRSILSDSNGRCFFDRLRYSKEKPTKPYGLQIGDNNRFDSGSFAFGVAPSTKVKLDPGSWWTIPPGTFHITVAPKRLSRIGFIHLRNGKIIDLRKVLALIFPDAKIEDHGRRIVLPSDSETSDYCAVQVLVERIPEVIKPQNCDRSLIFFASQVTPYKKPRTENLAAWENYIVFAVIEWTPEGLIVLSKNELYEKKVLREKGMGHFGLTNIGFEQVDSADVIALYYSYAEPKWPETSNWHDAASYFTMSESLELALVKSVDKIRK